MILGSYREAKLDLQAGLYLFIANQLYCFFCLQNNWWCWLPTLHLPHLVSIISSCSSVYVPCCSLDMMRPERLFPIVTILILFQSPFSWHTKVLEFFLTFNWNAVDLQYCVSFKGTAKWFRHTYIHVCVWCVCSVASVVSDSVMLWTRAHQAPLSMRFSQQECWSGLPYPPPGDLPNPGIEPMSLCLLHCRWSLYSLSHQGSWYTHTHTHTHTHTQLIPFSIIRYWI